MVLETLEVIDKKENISIIGTPGAGKTHYANTVKSIIITTNLEFARWNDIFADTKITAALLDRIIHHSHLLDFTKRDSRRLQDALFNKNG